MAAPERSAILLDVDPVALHPTMHLHPFFAELTANGGDVPVVLLQERTELLLGGCQCQTPLDLWLGCSGLRVRIC